MFQIEISEWRTNYRRKRRMETRPRPTFQLFRPAYPRRQMCLVKVSGPHMDVTVIGNFR